MSLTAGTRLGPYEILAPLGAGGMGEVYRARDTRLGREVAIKVVHPRFAADAEQLGRFEREARSASQLDDPNILVVHDIGSHEGSPYIVSELLEGESLREKLGAPLPPKKAIEYAVQAARGLAAAHEKGIVHRDIKPENLFVTREGRIKILDFGLAKLAQPVLPTGPLTEAPTAAPATEPGVVMGTVGYMSPEQVLGRELDARSDLFSLGAVLYEMLSGRRAFQKGSVPETMTAILKEEPPELSQVNAAVTPGLERIVRHCLEKEPTSRFQSARDLSFDLESLAQATTAGTAPLRAPRVRRLRVVVALGSLLLAAFAAGLFLLSKQAGRAPVPSFKRITLRRGNAGSARFTPDFQSVVYSARWEGRPVEVFIQRLASADVRSLGVTGASVIGAARGNVAVVREDGTIAQLPLEGGTPRDLVKNVEEATWEPSGRSFAVVRATQTRYRLEYPPGKVMLETTGIEWIGSPRFSPDGSRIAFALHHNRDDLSGDVCVVDTLGQKRTLSKGWADIETTVWSPDGDEVWFSATRAGSCCELYAVALSGKERLVARLPGSVLIQDIASDGRVLATFGQPRRFELRGRMAGDAAERDFSWLDGTLLPTLAPDGSQMVFQEWGEGGGVESSTYHWRMDGSAPKRLGEGTPFDVSPDWTTALVGVGSGETLEARLVPIGAGETTAIPRGPIHTISWGFFHPDGKRVVFIGSDAQGRTMLFVQRLDGGLPRPLAPAVFGGFSRFSTDGRFFPVKANEGAPWFLQPIDGGETHPIPFLRPGEWPLIFGDDGKSLYVSAGTIGPFPIHVVRLDLQTGARQPWLELTPPDRAGVAGALALELTPNGRFYTYGYDRRLSDLYLIEGLR